MKTKRINFVLSLLLSCSVSTTRAENFSAEELARRTMERRAVEAVVWGMPAVNYDLMVQEMLTKTPGKVNQMIYWGQPLDWHNHAHAESRHALLHGVPQYQGRRANRD